MRVAEKPQIQWFYKYFVGCLLIILIITVPTCFVFFSNIGQIGLVFVGTLSAAK